jgi:hypothetical protein
MWALQSLKAVQLRRCFFYEIVLCHWVLLADVLRTCKKGKVVPLQALSGLEGG